jgi:hypothetical protein
MLRRARITLTIAACALATSAAAQAPAPTTTAFDGSYAGVSMTLEGTMDPGVTRYCSPPGRLPPVLNVVNGIAQSRWGGPTDGSVSPQGVLVMRAQNGRRFDGQIDSHGTATGRWTGACSWRLVWQKK